MKHRKPIFIVFSIIIFTSCLYIYFIRNTPDPLTYIIPKCNLDKIIYLKSVLSNEQLLHLKIECLELFSKLVPEQNNITNRKHAIVNNNGPISNIFYGDAFISRLQNVLGFSVIPSKDLPIEFRYYDIGSSMKWHRDAIVTDNRNGTPQIEVVYTLHNISDSKTEWINDKNGQLNEIISEPNSIMITQGGSVLHQVTPVTSGNRAIIKIAYDVE